MVSDIIAPNEAVNHKLTLLSITGTPIQFAISRGIGTDWMGGDVGGVESNEVTSTAYAASLDYPFRNRRNSQVKTSPT